MKNKIKFIISLILFILIAFLELMMKTDTTLLNFCVLSIVNISIGFSCVYYYQLIRKNEQLNK